MRWLGAWLHGLLLVIALVGAYFTWDTGDGKKHDSKSEDRVPVWQAAGESASAVSYRHGEKSTRLWIEGQGKAARPWVEVTEPARKPRKPKGKEKADEVTPKPKPKADEVAPKPEADEVAPKPEAEAEPLPPRVTRFPGNTKARELLERLARPQAERALGQADPERLGSLGLAPVEATLEVTVGGEARTIEVGKVAYGTQGRYLRLAGTGEVFVAAADLVGDLKWAASRLKETDPFGPQAKEADRTEITLGEGMTKRLVRLAEEGGAKKKKSTRWADASRPDVEDEEATNWMRKLKRLRARKHLGGEAEAGAKVVLSVSFHAGSEPAGRAVLSRIGDDDKARFVIESPHLGGRAEVSSRLAGELLEDVSGLFLSR